MTILIAIYRIATKAYGLILHLASFFNTKAKLFIAGRKGLIGKIEKQLSGEQRPRIWMHCASLGEFEQGRPVLERFCKEYPHYAIVLTFFSPSGFEVRKNYAGADHIFYLPLDSPDHAKRFLDIVKPALSIFVKYEFWYFYLSAIKRAGINAILISGIFRSDQPFFKWYGKLHRAMLQSFTHIFLQNEASGALLRDIGLSNYTVNGDTRFDRVAEAARQKEKLFIADAFCDHHKIIVAGSTWKDDEVFLNKVMKLVPANWRMILAPHEINEQHIREIEKVFDHDTLRWSRWNDAHDKRVLIVDQIGILIQLYRLGYVAWIGGGFGKEGVHNVLEAAVYGIPCAYGPIYAQYAEAVDLIKAEGAFSTSDPAVFADNILRWERNDNAYQQAAISAKKYVALNQGATDSIMNYVAEKNLLTI